MQPNNPPIHPADHAATQAEDAALQAQHMADFTEPAIPPPDHTGPLTPTQVVCLADACRPDSDDLALPELLPLQRHLQCCPQDQAAVQQLQKTDELVAAAVHKVTVPPGLADRIRARLAQAQASATDTPPSGAPPASTLQTPQAAAEHNDSPEPETRESERPESEPQKLDSRQLDGDRVERSNSESQQPQVALASGTLTGPALRRSRKPLARWTVFAFVSTLAAVIAWIGVTVTPPDDSGLSAVFFQRSAREAFAKLNPQSLDWRPIEQSAGPGPVSLFVPQRVVKQSQGCDAFLDRVGSRAYLLQSPQAPGTIAVLLVARLHKFDPENPPELEGYPPTPSRANSSEPLVSVWREGDQVFALVVQPDPDPRHAEDWKGFLNISAGPIASRVLPRSFLLRRA